MTKPAGLTIISRMSAAGQAFSSRSLVDVAERCARAAAPVGQQCVSCVMDKSDPAIEFDDSGVCSHCHAHAERVRQVRDNQPARLERLIAALKRGGRGKRFDCVIGLSGGVDSSYLAMKVQDLGLRPLAVHLDNGWNSEAAVSNIHTLVSRLNLEFYTHVIDWTEFRELQLAYFDSSVIDIEALTDHAIGALLYRTAHKHGVKAILNGANVVTEAVLPSAWVHRKSDQTNILAIARTHRPHLKLKTYPSMPYREMAFLTGLGIKRVNILDYLPFEKALAVEELQTRVGWRPYGGKHYESVFTRFYQGVILPSKFGVDKRKAHLSALVISGSLARQEALAELTLPSLPPELLEQDFTYVAKKLEFSEEQLYAYLLAPPRAHEDYATDEKEFRLLFRLYGFIKSLRKAG